jgi:hypothetical protein
MPDSPLLAGPYKPPRFRVGKPLYDILRGDLIVSGISDSAAAWPVGTTHPGCRPLPIMTAELVRAIRAESESAVMAHWGVSRWTACRWRRGLGVPRFNPGTIKLWSQMAAVKLPDEMRQRAHAAQRQNAANRRNGILAPPRKEG